MEEIDGDGGVVTRLTLADVLFTTSTTDVSGLILDKLLSNPINHGSHGASMALLTFVNPSQGEYTLKLGHKYIQMAELLIYKPRVSDKIDFIEDITKVENDMAAKFRTRFGSQNLFGNVGRAPESLSIADSQSLGVDDGWERDRYIGTYGAETYLEYTNLHLGDS